MWAWPSKGQCTISKILSSLIFSLFIEQNIFFPETCFAYPISEQKFMVWKGFKPLSSNSTFWLSFGLIVFTFGLKIIKYKHKWFPNEILRYSQGQKKLQISILANFGFNLALFWHSFATFELRTIMYEGKGCLLKSWEVPK